MAPPNITDPHLLGSKNFYQRGLECERIVAKYFSNQGYIILFQKLFLYYAEVDLVVISPQKEIIILEVKSVNEDLVWRKPVSSEQKRRLRRAYESLLGSAGDFGHVVRMHLVTVDQQNTVVVFEDFLRE